MKQPQKRKMIYKISKEFELDFGHRVWTQELNPKLAGTSLNKCRFLHGHRGKIIIELASEQLNKSMVLDFNELNWFKEFIDRFIDHKFLVDNNDPAMGLNSQQIDIEELPHGMSVEITDEEIGQSFVYIPFVPTAENLCKWFYEIIEKKLGSIVYSVTFYETPKSKATYCPKM